MTALDRISLLPAEYLPAERRGSSSSASWRHLPEDDGVSACVNEAVMSASIGCTNGAWRRSSMIRTARILLAGLLHVLAAHIDVHDTYIVVRLDDEPDPREDTLLHQTQSSAP
jgi:hypothetical protein